MIRYNLIEGAISSGPQQPCAIYLDDCLAGQIVYGNITVNADALWIGGGKRNRVFNNIFVMTEHTSAVSYDQRGLGNDFMHETVTYPDGHMWVKITSYFSYLSDMQRFAVPENLLMIEQTGFSFESRPDDPGTPSYATVRDNLIYTERGGWEGSFMASAAARLGWMMSNVVYDTDPGFVDPDSGNYSLRDDSRVFRDIPGFENIDYASIGRTK